MCPVSVVAAFKDGTLLFYIYAYCERTGSYFNSIRIQIVRLVFSSLAIPSVFYACVYVCVFVVSLLSVC